MKQLMLFAFLYLNSINVIALTSEEKIIIDNNLNKIEEFSFDSKQNINNLNLRKAKQLLEKISTSVITIRKTIDTDVTPASYYCVIDSMLDGQFAGRGATILEGKNAAITSCFTGTRDEGKSCDRSTLLCEREN